MKVRKSREESTEQIAAEEGLEVGGDEDSAPSGAAQATRMLPSALQAADL